MKPNFHFALFLSLGIIFYGKASAQTWSDYIFEEKGDTVVVRGSSNMLAPYADALNTIAHAVLGDTLANGDRTNPNRVYETMPGETYIYGSTFEIGSMVPNLRIVCPPISDGTIKPLHIRTMDPYLIFFDKTFFKTEGSLYMQNQYFLLAMKDYTVDSELVRAEGVGSRYEYNNCIFELTRFCLFFSLAHHQTYKFTNCMFLNIGNEPSLTNGLAFNTTIPVDTLWFENNTILNHGGLSAAWIDSPVAPNFCYYNHNTIVNGIHNPFLYFSQAEMIVTNNLIINTGIVPDYPGFLEVHQDEDSLPKGIINVDTVEQAWINDLWPDSGYPFKESDRKIFVDRNNVWWDPRFTDMFDSLPAFPPYPQFIDRPWLEWLDQKILMNTRTKAMFADDAAYPYFTEGKWYNIEPDFTNNKDLVEEWAQFIVGNIPIYTAASSKGVYMPWWKTNRPLNLTTFDWPPLADLSYSNAILKNGGLNNYPVGDLNWFPAEKEEWIKTNESDTLIASLKSGVLPEVCIDCFDFIKKTEGFKNSIEVYPNPFSDRTTLRFDIQNSSNMELIVFNIIGEKVRTLDLGYFATGFHEVSLSKCELKPGIYIIHLNMDSDKMISKIIIH